MVDQNCTASVLAIKACFSTAELSIGMFSLETIYQTKIVNLYIQRWVVRTYVRYILKSKSILKGLETGEKYEKNTERRKPSNHPFITADKISDGVDKNLANAILACFGGIEHFRGNYFSSIVSENDVMVIDVFRFNYLPGFSDKLV